ncbi:MAG: 5-formyltetrahydrofolate cyclo-ligase [Planctomycetaceae bacterium]|jgi:5-formyltetrahydrofolate cyclo-ligase|nr:5-formyltetrahydrofolate cyclo-ligase [Planctomycetaceae bacterium]
MPDKNILRKFMKDAMSKYFAGSEDLRCQLSGQIWDALRQFSWFNEAEEASRLMIYLDCGNEPMTLDYARFPLIVPFCAGDDIVPIRVESAEELCRGRFGILEPMSQIWKLAERRVELDSIDVILVPGVLFDRECNRLGRGGGYYDRFLARLPEKNIRVGLCFAMQIFNSIPKEIHDQRVDIVITEKEIIKNKKFKMRFEGDVAGRADG